jgi:coenzyme F420-0:L-glutamate ligase/coenzyme F420-1:gamma-L-glutamate ligase
MAIRNTQTKALHAFLRTRRSIRRLKPDAVPETLVIHLLETAVHAPSAHNLQPWRFAIVMTASARARLGEALAAALRADMLADGASETDIRHRIAGSLRRITEAPVLIVLCRDVTAVRQSKPQDAIMAVQSVANAATYLLLAAHAEGLGGNWICWPLYAQAETRTALNLPETWEPQAMVFLGYPDEAPKDKTLKPLKEVVIKV